MANQQTLDDSISSEFQDLVNRILSIAKNQGFVDRAEDTRSVVVYFTGNNFRNLEVKRQIVVGYYPPPGIFHTLFWYCTNPTNISLYQKLLVAVNDGQGGFSWIPEFDPFYVYTDNPAWEIAKTSTGGGGGSTTTPTSENFVTLYNSSTQVVKKGQVVFATGSNNFGLSVATDSEVKRTIGLVYDDLIAPSSSGVIQIDGIITINNTQWLEATGLSGGISNSNHWVSDVTMGALTPNPVISDVFPKWSLKVGYGIDGNRFKIEIQPSVKI